MKNTIQKKLLRQSVRQLDKSTRRKEEIKPRAYQEQPEGRGGPGRHPSDLDETYQGEWCRAKGSFWRRRKNEVEEKAAERKSGEPQKKGKRGMVGQHTPTHGEGGGKYGSGGGAGTAPRPVVVAGEVAMCRPVKPSWKEERGKVWMRVTQIKRKRLPLQRARNPNRQAPKKRKGQGEKVKGGPSHNKTKKKIAAFLHVRIAVTGEICFTHQGIIQKEAKKKTVDA